MIKGVAYDTPDPGLRREHLQRADAVERAGRRVVRAGRLQHRRLLQGRRGRGHLRDRHQGAVPQRRARGGQAAAAAAAVLLRVVLAAARPAHHGRPGRRVRARSPGAIRVAAQRHPPVDRRRRADAAAGRRTSPRLGRGVGDHGGHLRLHQPHPAARGAGEVAAGDVRRVAAAPPRDHLRDQPPLPRRGAREVPRRRRPGAADVADRRGRRQDRPDGAPRHGRQPRDQRRRGPALRPAEGQRAQGLLRAVAGAVLQQDQRRHAAALPGAVQPRPAGAARRDDRRRLADRPGPAARPGGVRRRPRVPGQLAGGQARQQGPAGRVPALDDGRRAGSRAGCSTSRSSASTSTSAST